MLHLLFPSLPADPLLPLRSLLPSSMRHQSGPSLRPATNLTRRAPSSLLRLQRPSCMPREHHCRLAARVPGLDPRRCPCLLTLRTETQAPKEHKQMFPRRSADFTLHLNCLHPWPHLAVGQPTARGALIWCRHVLTREGWLLFEETHLVGRCNRHRVQHVQASQQVGLLPPAATVRQAGSAAVRIV